MSGHLHACTPSCFDKLGIRTCHNRNEPVEEAKLLKDKESKAAAVLSVEALAMMGELLKLNNSLVSHRLNLKMNEKLATNRQRELEECLDAVRGESELISEKIAAVQELKKKLIVELNEIQPEQTELMAEEIGRSS